MQSRQYQQEAVASLWDYFATKSGNPVVAMPTGSGKSIVIAAFLESIFRTYPNQKILILTHVKELIEQNYTKLMALWPTAPAGIFSSGLRKKDLRSSIIFAGIASVVKHTNELNKIDLIIIDEAHLVSPKEETLYQKLILALKIQNPFLKIVGLTATPWRLGQGHITQDGIFTDVCFDITSMAAFNRLIKEGYLAPLIPRHTNLLLDVTGVQKIGGEFKANQLQFAVDKDEITFAALSETIEHGAGRHSWLVFGSGVEHVKNITSMLEHLGVNARCVHSKMAEKERDANIADWKAGRFTAIVNNGILTTGIDHPALDLIVMLRPTASTVLWCQMLGRGTRPYYASGYNLDTVKGRIDAIQASPKSNCLVLDFAGNTSRLGPINDPVVPRAKGKGTGEAPIRICDVCNMYNHASARYCGGEPFPTNEGCGHAFTFTTKLKRVASTNDLIKNDHPIVQEFSVESVTYAIHNKIGKPPSLRVSYFSKMQKFSDYIHFELPGWGERKSKAWWADRSNEPAPTTTAEASQKANSLRVPKSLKVWINKPYPEIMSVEF